jgi:1-deoxy-D-xylulose-5-phosphate reductoisomerase
VLNAANETAVAAFLGGKIPFGAIFRMVELTIARHRPRERPTMTDLLEADRWARRQAELLLQEQRNVNA